jgi:Sec-independent protein translocase protein TatA
MFDIGWGETFVVIGVSFYFIGRKDLPRAARFMGTHVGRVVGLLQGARVRADRFAAQSELRQLQNELRSGLRELDAVRSEMAIAVSSQGLVGRTLGATVAGVNKSGKSPQAVRETTTSAVSKPGLAPVMNMPPISAVASHQQADTPPTSLGQVRELAPRSQAVAAVAEEEWQKQGISFMSRAERGMGDATGSAMLARLYQQTLIHDQHDRVVQEQDEALRARIVEKERKSR